MKKSPFLASVIISLIALFAMSIGLFSPYRPHLFPESGSLKPVESIVSLGDLPPTHNATAIFVLSNTTNHDIRIIGSTDRCGLGGCIIAQSLPKQCLSSQQVAITIEVRTPAAEGHFRLSTTLFTDDPQQLRLDVKVDGNVQILTQNANLLGVTR